jgi:hypothetical protein
VAMTTLRAPGGVISKTLVWTSEGRAELGGMISSGTLEPRAFIRSKRISQAVSIFSWPVKKRRMLPGGSERWMASL